jgi:hypothetical protein
MKRTDFTPRPARLELRIDGATCWRLRLEQAQARILLRTLRIWESMVVDSSLDEGETARDEDICDALQVALQEDIMSSGGQNEILRNQ